MDCPVCTDVKLAMADRQGIEIDYCPQCRGVWLDRGELDKLIERADAQTPQAPPQRDPRPQPPAHEPPRREYRESHDRHYDDRYYKKKKKKDLLGELFDF